MVRIVAVLFLFQAAAAYARGPATLAIIGDVMLGWGLDKPIRKGVDPFAGVRPVLQGANLAFANLEGPITRRGTRAKGKRFTFRTPPERVAMLSGSGLDALALANNHILDYGDVGLADTIGALGGAGICTAGAGVNLAAARKPVWFESRGLPVALLSYNLAQSSTFRATATKAGAAFAEQGNMVADVRSARALGAQVIVMLHWGLDQTGILQDRQRVLASALAKAGAVLIVGSHPHVAQGTERIGKSVTVYSLGDGVFGGNPRRKDDSLVLRARLGEHGLELVELLALNANRLETGSVAAIRTGADATKPLGRIKRLSRKLGTVLADGKTAEGWPCLTVDIRRPKRPVRRPGNRGKVGGGDQRTEDTAARLARR